MGEASTNINLATFLEIPIDQEESQVITATHAHHPHHHTISPIWRLSPRHNGSTLYDSFELRAVTQQLNKAIQASNASSPHYMYCFNSPFYRPGLTRICKQIVRTPKQVLRSQVSCATTVDKRQSPRPAAVVSRGFVTRAWRKVKQGFLNGKQRNG